MSTAPDGSPVGLYTRVPELGEGEVVASAVRADGSVLELGCGTGRMTGQLVRLGYRVTAAGVPRNLPAARRSRGRGGAAARVVAGGR